MERPLVYNPTDPNTRSVRFNLDDETTQMLMALAAIDRTEPGGYPSCLASQIVRACHAYVESQRSAPDFDERVAAVRDRLAHTIRFAGVDFYFPDDSGATT